MWFRNSLAPIITMWGVATATCSSKVKVTMQPFGLFYAWPMMLLCMMRFWNNLTGTNSVITLCVSHLRIMLLAQRSWSVHTLGEPRTLSSRVGLWNNLSQINDHQPARASLSYKHSSSPFFFILLFIFGGLKFNTIVHCLYFMQVSYIEIGLSHM